MPTPSLQSLEYQALTAPVTPEDRAAYRQAVVARSNRPEVMQTLAMYILIVFAVLILAFSSINDVLAVGPLVSLLITLAILSIVAGLGFYFTHHRHDAKIKLYRFAMANGLTFTVDRRQPGYAGMIFTEGYNQRIEAALGVPGLAELGNYTFETGAGKGHRIHNWGYIYIKLNRQIPQMVLDGKGNNLFGVISNLQQTFNRSQTISLEGDFDKYFTLYAPQEYEADARYVFTPDVMATLIDHGRDYDFEIVGDNLFMYKNSPLNLTTEEDLRNILVLTQEVGGEMHDQTARYADDRVGDRTQNVVAAAGRRLKTSWSWLIAVPIVLYIAMFVTGLPALNLPSQVRLAFTVAFTISVFLPVLVRMKR